MTSPYRRRLQIGAHQDPAIEAQRATFEKKHRRRTAATMAIVYASLFAGAVGVAAFAKAQAPEEKPRYFVLHPAKKYSCDDEQRELPPETAAGYRTEPGGACEF